MWTRSEQDGTLTFSVPRPPGDFCTITLFAGDKAEADFSRQFDAAIALDQKAKGTVTTEADSGAKPGRAQDGIEVLTRNLRCETDSLRTLHIYYRTRSGDRFDRAAFQTTSERSRRDYGPEAVRFIQSIRPANSLPPDQVAKLLGLAPAKAAAAPPPELPGFDAPLPPPAPVPAPDTPPAAAAARRRYHRTRSRSRPGTPARAIIHRREQRGDVERWQADRRPQTLPTRLRNRQPRHRRRARWRHPRGVS